MASGLTLLLLASLGCAITVHADEPSRDHDDPADIIHQAQDTPRTINVPKPVFTDWKYKMVAAANGSSRYPANPNTNDPCSLLEDFNYDSVNTYVPMPMPEGGHGIGYSGDRSWVAKCSAQKVADAGAPVVVFIRERNCPFPFNTNGRRTSPDALRHALDAVPRLDYLFMDLEMNDEMVELNIPEIVRTVRSHPNPDVANAFIGNYHELAATYDRAYVWEPLRTRDAVGPQRWNRAALYANSGLNVSMPNAYPFEAYSVHSKVGAQGEAGITPNDRAALLWAPVEHVSAAARALPEGHKLVPYVTTYIEHPDPTESEMYNAPPSPSEDAAALIQHIRLRGSDGFVFFSPVNVDSNHPELNYETYRDLALKSWASLDHAFNDAETVDILTLTTEKTSGLIWSGVRNGNKVTILVSNLSGLGGSLSVRLPDIDGLPATSPPVSDGSHQTFVFDLQNGNRNLTETPEERTNARDLDSMSNSELGTRDDSDSRSIRNPRHKFRSAQVRDNRP
jgi:hypothetical protein